METFTAKVSKDLREHLSKASKGMYKKEVLPDGRVRVTGGPRLKSSGAYAPGFGKHVAKLLKRRSVSQLIIVVYIYLCWGRFYIGYSVPYCMIIGLR